MPEDKKEKIFSKMGETRKGKISGIAGKRTSNNINCITKGEYNVKEQPSKTSISIKCNETGEVFNSIRECCVILKISHEALSEYLNGKRNYPIGGYTFTSLGHQVVPYIILMESEKTFETVKDCCDFLNANKSSVCNVLNGKYKTCKGYHICYYKNYSKEENPFFGKEPSKPKKSKK